MINYPFKFIATIEENNCFPNLILNPSSALLFIQRAATGHLDSLGYTYERLKNEGIVFMVANSATKFYKNLRAHEKVTVATCPAISKGAQILRETCIFNENGERVCENQSAWIMLNPENGKILRPTEFKYKLPILEEYNPFCDATRIKIPKSDNNLGERKVRLSDIDRNSHMNNTIYSNVLTDSFAEEVLNGKGVDTLFIKYKNQARMGDVLAISGEKNSDGVFAISAHINESMCFQGMFTLKK